MRTMILAATILAATHAHAVEPEASPLGITMAAVTICDIYNVTPTPRMTAIYRTVMDAKILNAMPDDDYTAFLAGKTFFHNAKNKIGGDLLCSNIAKEFPDLFTKATN